MRVRACACVQIRDLEARLALAEGARLQSAAHLAATKQVGHTRRPKAARTGSSGPGSVRPGRHQAGGPWGASRRVGPGPGATQQGVGGGRGAAL